MQTETEQLQEAESALCDIMVALGYSDPSEGEGTSPQEVVEAVKERLQLIETSSGVFDIALERARQINQEGWTRGHDMTHVMDELALAAAVYAIPHAKRVVEVERHGCAPISLSKLLWPFDDKWFKPAERPHRFNERLRELAKAGALIAAEIDRLKGVLLLRPKELPVPQRSTRELELEELLRSAHAIALRKGDGTAWERFATSIQKQGVGSVTPRTYRVLEGDSEA